MKKIIALFISFAMLITIFAGCKREENTDTQAEKQELVIREVVDVKYHESSEKFAGGNGTETDPYQISNANELAYLGKVLKNNASEYSEAHYVLTADISLNDVSDFENWSSDAPEYGWEPISMDMGLDCFAGVFDGNGHKITGIFIDADGNQTETNKDYYGLFAELKGIVKNLTVEQSYMRTSGSLASVGTIAGYTYDAVVENCHADTIVELYGMDNAGGITGKGGNISGCTYSGTITEHNEKSFVNMGGITGAGGNISDCTFTGALSGKGYTGGIVGYGEAVKNCINKGNVSGDIVGGITGRIYEAGTDQQIENPERIIENCINEGKVTGTTLAGGIVGWIGNDESDVSVTIANCENKGQVNCDESVAGIIGKLSVERTGTIKVENCVNHSDVTSKGKAGGIICDVTGAILHQEGDVVVSGCKNLGNIVSEGLYSAGVITYLLVMGNEVDLKLTVDSCSNEGEIQSAECAGGILGFSSVGASAEVVAKNTKISDDTKVTLSNCKNSGSVTVKRFKSMVGGIVGVLGLGYIPTEIKNCINTGSVNIDFTLTDKQIEESKGSELPEFYQIAGGIVGRIGDALMMTTGEGVETDDDNVNTEDGNIMISGCSSTGTISASDYSFILNKWEKPLYVNYLGGVVGQCSATNGYAFGVENCIYSGAVRGLGDDEFTDIGTKK